jgi:hypothetical protein
MMGRYSTRSWDPTPGRGLLLRDAIRPELAERAPGARLVKLEAPPVVGAAVMAMERLGTEVRERLAAGAARLLEARPTA